jgi:alginate O-acetyltransferase complex protein AlgI
MSLNSPLFLFLFLPVVLLLHLVAGRKIRNTVVLIASLVFLIFCDPIYFLLLLGLVFVNYPLSLWLVRKSVAGKKSRGFLIFVIGLNILVLLSFKLVVAYFPQLRESLLEIFPSIPITTDQLMVVGKYVVIPIGLSFFTFQVLSYQIDIYNGTIKHERNLLHFSLYLLMFPRLIAGPIMRFGEIDGQLHDRQISLERISDGSRRFIRGLAKKILIADQLAAIDQGIFVLTSGSISTPIAWLSLISFSLRIYFDFSGYTDMALGIGQMLGFQFAENFNYPYISRSLTEFWRRWHMTLAGWFREYVFYPLERHRRGSHGFSQSMNILIVFVLTGLWHGVTLNFILWGFFQGIMISIESAFLGKFLKKQHPIFQHLYSLVIIAISWLIFASPSLTYTLQFLKSMIGLEGSPQFLSFYNFPPLQPQAWLAILFGVLLSFPIFPKIKDSIHQQYPRGRRMFSIFSDIVHIGILVLSLIVLANSTFHPYIYGRF